MGQHTGRLLIAVACAVPALLFDGGVQADAPAGRYTQSGGTVSDTKTKLTWQQPPASTAMTWASARTYCANLGGTLGGSGWRLPTERELLTLVDYSRGTAPPIDQTYFSGTPAAFFWSVTPLAGSTSSAWAVDFTFGISATATQDSALDVRCVK
jgi:hypothetical protein